MKDELDISPGILKTLIQDIPPILRTATIIVGTVCGLITAGVMLSAYRNLPAEVQENKKQVEEINFKLGARFDSLTGVVKELKTELVQINTTGQMQLCLAVAEKKQSNWRKCFLDKEP